MSGNNPISSDALTMMLCTPSIHPKISFGAIGFGTKVGAMFPKRIRQHVVVPRKDENHHFSERRLFTSILHHTLKQTPIGLTNNYVGVLFFF